MTTIKSRTHGVPATHSRIQDRVRGFVSTPARVVAAIMLGVLVRGFHILSSGYPLNDGGMFFAMAQDL